MWTTVLQIGELIDTANRMYDPVCLVWVAQLSWEMEVVLACSGEFRAGREAAQVVSLTTYPNPPKISSRVRHRPAPGVRPDSRAAGEPRSATWCGPAFVRWMDGWCDSGDTR